jgi:hypothetical protein
LGEGQSDASASSMTIGSLILWRIPLGWLHNSYK